MAALNGLHEVVGSVVDTLQNFSIALRVGRPLHDNFVETVGRLEFTIDRISSRALIV